MHADYVFFPPQIASKFVKHFHPPLLISHLMWSIIGKISDFSMHKWYNSFPIQCFKSASISCSLVLHFIMNPMLHLTGHHCHLVYLCDVGTCHRSTNIITEELYAHSFLPDHQSPYFHRSGISEGRVWAKSPSCSFAQQRQTGCSGGLLLPGLCADRSKPALWPPQVGAEAAFPGLQAGVIRERTDEQTVRQVVGGNSRALVMTINRRGRICWQR